MEADWDADDFEPPTPVTAVAVKSDKWEGEDEEEPVKESWEDEDETALAESKPQATPATKKKSSKRLEEKIAEKERKAKEEAEARRQLLEANMTPEERLAEKLRRQKLVEEADLEVAMETFGITPARGGVLDDADPNSKEEFLDFKSNLIRKIHSFSTRPNYSEFVEEFMKEICAGLDVDVLKKVSQTAKSIHEEKLRMVKAASKPGKKGKTKVVLKMDRDVDTYVDDYGGGDYDDFM